MGLGPSSAVLETLRRNNPGFTLQVDFGPSGANYFAGPEPRQQRDFEGSAMPCRWRRAAGGAGKGAGSRPQVPRRTRSTKGFWHLLGGGDLRS
jgi:hypothetical protein